MGIFYEFLVQLPLVTAHAARWHATRPRPSPFPLPTWCACYAAIGHDPYSPKYERDGYQTVLTRWVVPACAILGFVFMLNHQRYWRHHEFWATAMFTLPIVMLPAIRCAFGWGGGMRRVAWVHLWRSELWATALSALPLPRCPLSGA